MAETDNVVARYAMLKPIGGAGLFPTRDPDGEYVLYTALEAAQAENEALRRARDEALAKWDAAGKAALRRQDALDAEKAAREAAEAKAARLKEALVAQRAFILHWTDDVNGGLKPTLGSLRSALDAARAALEA